MTPLTTTMTTTVTKRPTKRDSRYGYPGAAHYSRAAARRALYLPRFETPTVYTTARGRLVAAAT